MREYHHGAKRQRSKLISGLKKLKENQKAANQEKDLVSLFERRFNELEKKIDDTQTSMKAIKKSGELIETGHQKFNKRKLCRDHQVNRKSDHPRFSKDTL